MLSYSCNNNISHAFQTKMRVTELGFPVYHTIFLIYRFSKTCTDPLKADNLKNINLILYSILSKFLALIGTGQKWLMHVDKRVFETSFPAGFAE